MPAPAPPFEKGGLGGIFAGMPATLRPLFGRETFP